jgi:hypothetical protein
MSTSSGSSWFSHISPHHSFSDYLRLALQHYGAEVHTRYTPECTHLLTQYCVGDDYEQVSLLSQKSPLVVRAVLFKAVRDRAVIVTAVWLFDSIKSGKILDPASRSLSYKPLTDGVPVPGLSGKVDTCEQILTR